MSQQDAAKQQANTRNNIRVVSIFTAAAIGLVGVLVILYAWQLPPFTRHSQFTDNAYVRGQTTFISPQVNGYITAVNVKDFAIVQPGEVLFQIDDRIYKQRVHQAQATLAMKEAALRNNLQQRKSAEATIAKNEAALQNAATLQANILAWNDTYLLTAAISAGTLVWVFWRLIRLRLTARIALQRATGSK